MSEHHKSPDHPIFSRPAMISEAEVNPWESNVRRYSIDWAGGTGADTLLYDDGEYYVDWIEVASSLQGKGVATELFRRIETHARRLGAKRITALLTSEGSAKAARRAYGAEYVVEQSLDEYGRDSSHPEFSGHDHYTPALDYPIEYPAAEADQAGIDEIEQLMGADKLPEPELRKALGRSAATRDLDELEQAKGSRG